MGVHLGTQSSVLAGEAGLGGPPSVAPRAQGDQPGARGVCARERLGLAPVSGADTDLRHVSESLPTTPT